MNERSENLVVVQCTRLDVSAGFSVYQNPKEVGSNTSEGMDLPIRVKSSRQKAEFSFFHVFSIGCQKVQPRLKVDPSTSEDLD